ncbi:MAG: DUF4920 domain-containing protein [Cyclobacteriaceae bacterium]
MKSTYLKIAVLCTILGVIGCEQGRKKANNLTSIEYSSYGDSISPNDVVDIGALASAMNGADSVELKITGTIDKTCKMKGCWMTLKTPNEPVRVTFKDYGFFVPKQGQEGNEAVVEGTAYRTITSVDELKHYAKDAGKSDAEIAAITEPIEEYTFIANGVLIKENNTVD